MDFQEADSENDIGGQKIYFGKFLEKHFWKGKEDAGLGPRSPQAGYHIREGFSSPTGKLRK